MLTFDIKVLPESAGDHSDIEFLHEMLFGPGRFARTAFRIRETAREVRSLGFVARNGGHLIGSVRVSAIEIGRRPSLLLGPLAVDRRFQGRGAGKALVLAVVEKAADAGHESVLLVGDMPYYGPLGFERVAPGTIRLPGPVDPGRLLIAYLGDDERYAVRGEVKGVRP